MRVVVKEESNPKGADVMERISKVVFPRYAPWDRYSILGYLRVGGRVFVAYGEDGAMGGAFLRRMTDSLWELTMIGVFPEYRRMGVGRRLMERILEETEGDIYLHVEVNNVAAINLYTGFGFKIVKEIKKFYSTGEDAYLMVLRRTPNLPKKASEVFG